MAWVRLIEDYEDNKAGEVVNLPAVIARELVHNRKAADGEAVLDYKNYDKATVEYDKRVETITPKPLSGTVKKIKKWLDDNGVEYSSTANKPELLEILKEA